MKGCPALCFLLTLLIPLVAGCINSGEKISSGADTHLQGKLWNDTAFRGVQKHDPDSGRPSRYPSFGIDDSRTVQATDGFAGTVRTVRDRSDYWSSVEKQSDRARLRMLDATAEQNSDVAPSMAEEERRHDTALKYAPEELNLSMREKHLKALITNCDPCFRDNLKAELAKTESQIAGIESARKQELGGAARIDTNSVAVETPSRQDDTESAVRLGFSK